MLTGKEVTDLFHKCFDPVFAEWDKKLERQGETNMQAHEERNQLRARISRLERIIERIGKDALQERV